MNKTAINVMAAAILTVCSVTGALAQSAATGASATSNGRGGDFSTEGQRMPDVGRSQSAGVTTFDRKQEHKMSKETSICKGC